MTDKFFRPKTKGEIYHKIDWEGMFQYVKEFPETVIPKTEIELLCKIATARALDHIYAYGLVTTEP